MAKNNKNLNSNEIRYIKLAYEQAAVNLGSTAINPSVGCVVVKNNSVISSGRTSLSGRPHAEVNTLQKKIDFKNSDLYVTLEPCSHYGKTPPCTNKIISKKIKRVIFSIIDTDVRSKEKAKKILENKKISVKKSILKRFAKSFYQSYFLQKTKKLPLIDAKLAISKDFFTINKKNKWITNIKSRRLGNFLRSKYDCLVTTSKTINDDNPSLDCRIEGLENQSPDLVIMDRFFKIKKNCKVFKVKKRKIYIFTTRTNLVKESFLKKKGIKIIRFLKKSEEESDLKDIFYSIKKLGFNRILVESGGTFLNQMMRYNLIKNFYFFKSSKSLNFNGVNNTSLFYVKKIKLSKKNKVKINLKEDELHIQKL